MEEEGRTRVPRYADPLSVRQIRFEGSEDLRLSQERWEQLYDRVSLLLPIEQS
jgi:hypothetical protein